MTTKVRLLLSANRLLAVKPKSLLANVMFNRSPITHTSLEKTMRLLLMSSKNLKKKDHVINSKSIAFVISTPLRSAKTVKLISASRLLTTICLSYKNALPNSPRLLICANSISVAPPKLMKLLPTILTAPVMSLLAFTMIKAICLVLSTSK
jgi:hypothetical protein